MTDKLKQTTKEELAKLPKEMQEAINVCDWSSITEQIGKKYLPNESEINDFQVETLLVLAGLEESDSYARNIENKVGATKDEATQMAGEAFEKIFEPIMNNMEENIKKNLKNKNANATQNIDFILSGGDYSVFIEGAYDNNPDMQKTDKLLGSSNILEVKKRLID